MFRKMTAPMVALAILLGVLPYVLLSIGKAADPFSIHTDKRYQPPGVAQWFGRDGLGRSVLARTLYATGLSFKVVSQALLVSFSLALVLGGIAGLARGKLPDAVISWTISLLYTVPFVLIAVAVAAVLQPGINSTYLLIGLIGWAAPARLFRAEVMQLRSARFVQSQRAFGISEPVVFLKSILPLAVLPPFLSLLFFVPELVAIDVGLSFFGLGAQPPTPTLGRLIYDGFGEFRVAWWITTMPAISMLIIFFLLYQTADKLSACLPKGQ